MTFPVSAMIWLLCLWPALAAATGEAPPFTVAVEARAVQPGELLVVNVAAPADATAVTVAALGADSSAFKVDERTWRAMVGIDLDQPPGRVTLVATIVGGASPTSQTTTIDVEPKSFPTRRLQVAPAFVSPSAAQRRRIEAESQFLRDVYARSDESRLWVEPFTRPVPGVAGSRFGARSVFNGEARAPHTGADFRAAAGTPVRAPNAGRVVAARNLFFAGNTVIIDHGLGVFSLLAHLSRIDVREGDVVKNAQVVGLVGATGRVTGPHLHWSLRVSRARVDPLSLLALLGADDTSAAADPHFRMRALGLR